MNTVMVSFNAIMG